MIYFLLVILPAAIILLVPQLFQLIILYPVYLFLRGIQIMLQFINGKDYGRKKEIK